MLISSGVCARCARGMLFIDLWFGTEPFFRCFSLSLCVLFLISYCGERACRFDYYVTRRSWIKSALKSGAVDCTIACRQNCGNIWFVSKSQMNQFSIKSHSISYTHSQQMREFSMRWIRDFWPKFAHIFRERLFGISEITLYSSLSFDGFTSMTNQRNPKMDFTHNFGQIIFGPHRPIPLRVVAFKWNCIEKPIARSIPIALNPIWIIAQKVLIVFASSIEHRASNGAGCT